MKAIIYNAATECSCVASSHSAQEEFCKVVEKYFLCRSNFGFIRAFQDYGNGSEGGITLVESSILIGQVGQNQL